MLRVASNALIVPPFECAWLSLRDYELDGAFCVQFDCKGENDVTIILKPLPGAKRWQHYQRQQGPAGAEHLAVEDNYTVILGSHRNSKLKVEKNGDEKASASGLPGCTVNHQLFTTCWINYAAGTISIGTGPAGSSLIFQWSDSAPAIADIQHIGLSCWDKHVSYRNVQVLPPLEPKQLAQQQQQLLLKLKQASLQEQQEPSASMHPEQQLIAVPSLLQLVIDAIIDSLSPAAVCHVLHLSELLLPRTQQLYDAAVQLAGRWFDQLVQRHLDELAGLSVDVLADILQEPLLEVSELLVFQAVAAWCQFGCAPEGQYSPAAPAHANASDQQQQQQTQGSTNNTTSCDAQSGFEVARPVLEVEGVLQLVRFAFMSEAEIQAVLTHPFTQQCPLVLQHLQHDLQQLRDSSGSMSPTGQYTFEQRRLVRPAAAAAPATGASTAAAAAVAAAAALSAQGSHPCCLVPPSAEGETHSSLSNQECEACAAGAGAATAADPASSSHQQQPGVSDLSQPPAPGGCCGGCMPAAAAAAAAGAAAAAALPFPAAALTATAGGAGCRAVGLGRYRRRLAPSCKELMYVCDGDRNGVVHFIATDYGTKQWVNPVLSKAVEIKASSPPSRYTDPKAIVSGQFLNTSFAGPRYIRSHQLASAASAACTSAAAAAGVGTPSSSSSSSSQSTPSTWWQLDLGPQHRLLCNYYTIRHDGSQDGFVRSWVLQGSNDLQHWINLRRHGQDSSIRLPGQYGSWPVTGPAAAMPFRAFRLLLLGPTNSPTSPWAFCLSHWELYGYFYNLSNDAPSKAGAATAATAAPSSAVAGAGAGAGPSALLH